MSIDAAIIGTGQSLGSIRVSSADLDTRFDKKNGWFESQSGVVSRSYIAASQSQLSMALSAAEAALISAEIEASDLSLILFAASVGYQPIPATAALIKHKLGLDKSIIGAFDVNATCLSLIAAMEFAELKLATGKSDNILIVSSEIASRALPWTSDPKTAGLFGDGAGAIVVSNAKRTNRLRLIDSRFETHSEGYELCALPAGGTRYDFHRSPEKFAENASFQMDGKALFKLTRKRFPVFVDALMDQAGLTKSDIDLVVPHQASPLALQHMIKSCGFESETVVDTVKQTGNLVAASLPITLDTAWRTGLICKGSRVLMLGTSAGVSFGGAILQAV